MSDEKRQPVIVAAARTPIGKFLGSLAPLSAPELGAAAIRAAVGRSGIPVNEIEEVIMGPLALADFIGLDTCLAILEVLHDGLGDPKYRPCPLLRKYVAQGWLGRKTKRGFYAY